MSNPHIPRQDIPETAFELSEQDKRAFCAVILKKFGVTISIDNEFLPMYYMAYMSASVSEKSAKNAEATMIKLITEFDKRASSSLAQALIDIRQIVEEFKVDSAANVAKLETKQYRFDDPKTAFFFAFGKYGITACFISLLLFICFMVVYLNR